MATGRKLTTILEQIPALAASIAVAKVGYPVASDNLCTLGGQADVADLVEVLEVLALDEVPPLLLRPRVCGDAELLDIAIAFRRAVLAVGWGASVSTVRPRRTCQGCGGWRLTIQRRMAAWCR